MGEFGDVIQRAMVNKANSGAKNRTAKILGGRNGQVVIEKELDIVRYASGVLNGFIFNNTPFLGVITLVWFEYKDDLGPPVCTGQVFNASDVRINYFDDYIPVGNKEMEERMRAEGLTPGVPYEEEEIMPDARKMKFVVKEHDDIGFDTEIKVDELWHLLGHGVIEIKPVRGLSRSDVLTSLAAFHQEKTSVATPDAKLPCE